MSGINECQAKDETIIYRRGLTLVSSDLKIQTLLDTASDFNFIQMKIACYLRVMFFFPTRAVIQAGNIFYKILWDFVNVNRLLSHFACFSICKQISPLVEESLILGSPRQ